YFPARIFLEKVSFAEAARVLTIETAWLAVFLAAALQVWRAGIRSYAAEGG
ncbi:MAG: ABC-2 family transporter protein, partial [Elusimicrobiota bacterium]